MQLLNLDDLETDFGTAILSELTGQALTRNRQPVRLFDQTRHSSEYFFRSDEQGKPYIQNFAEGKRYYPLTAYCQAYGVEYATALADLCQQYSLANGLGGPSTTRVERPIQRPAPVDFLPQAVYALCQNQFEQNGFYAYLRELFDERTASDLFNRYRLGSSRRWLYEGMLATCLPQFDTEGKLHQVKVIPFHPVSGRRAKAHQNAQRWNSRTSLYEPDQNEKIWFAGKTLAGSDTANLQQCYFGQHLLGDYPDKPVALVEGESTAVVCSAIWTDYIWLATGGSNGGKWYDPERFNALQGRKVVLWPDSGKYADWSEKAQPLRHLTASLTISQYVEQNAPQGASNIDLRDLLTQPPGNQEEANPRDANARPVEPAPKAWMPPTTRIGFPSAPLAWDADEQFQRIQWCVIPLDVEGEADLPGVPCRPSLADVPLEPQTIDRNQATSHSNLIANQ